MRRITLTIDSSHLFDVLAQNPDLSAALGQRLVGVCLAEVGFLDAIALRVYGFEIEPEPKPQK